MKVELVLKDFDFRLRSEAGSFPAVEINIFAVVTSRKADIDAVRMSAFKSKVRAAVETRPCEGYDQDKIAVLERELGRFVERHLIAAIRRPEP